MRVWIVYGIDEDYTDCGTRIFRPVLVGAFETEAAAKEERDKFSRHFTQLLIGSKAVQRGEPVDAPDAPEAEDGVY